MKKTLPAATVVKKTKLYRQPVHCVLHGDRDKSAWDHGPGGIKIVVNTCTGKHLSVSIGGNSGERCEGNKHEGLGVK